MTDTATTVLAWHFAKADMICGYDDSRTITPGETLTVDCDPTPCESGLHGSEDILDALQYTPGPMICRVEISGKIARQDDKLCGQSRKCLWVVDGDVLLRRFARWCALSVVDMWDTPDVVMQYLRTGDDSIRAAAGNAAGVAARDARDAAWAARDARGAWDAAEDAARDAAWDAAWAAAWAARDARDAAWAARDAARAAAWAAAWAAVRDAARAAARDAQSRELERLVMMAHRGEEIPMEIKHD